MPVKREGLLPPVVVYILQVEIVHQSVISSDEIMFECTAKRSFCHCGLITQLSVILPVRVQFGSNVRCDCNL